ncbi:MAG: leucyl aminopeptidase family protein [Candidatus Binataceae bacterium]
MTSPLSLLVEPGDHAIPISAIASERLEPWLAAQTAPVRHWLTVTGFKGEAGGIAVMSDPHGEISRVVVGLGRGDDPWVMGGLAKALPKGVYRLTESFGEPRDFQSWAALAWTLGAYAFSRYKSEAPPERAHLEWPEGSDRFYVINAVNAICVARDLINTPASDMLPDNLEQAARDVAGAFGASVRVTTGDDLLAANYPMIHAVGRASTTPPRLIDFTWGQPSAPKVTLVGKGVCFDTGGLDLKPSSAMALMKKDMGGAAVVLGLAQMIMASKLPVRLRVLVPAVENAVGGNAFRPGDVLKTRKGISVEIGNTDAEGRLVLGDALTEALTEEPALLIDCATLTGAARTALGPDLPAMFTDDEALAADLIASAESTRDPLWRLPLWAPYRKMIDSKIADMNNAGDSPFAGAITAALFLKEFVKPKEGVRPWVHLDLYGWNPAERPGRPAGGEGMAIRALFDLIRKRFAE